MIRIFVETGSGKDAPPDSGEQEGCTPGFVGPACGTTPPLPPPPLFGTGTQSGTGSETQSGATSSGTAESGPTVTEIQYPERLIAEYSYDALGRRVSKTLADRVVSYSYDGQKIIEETVTDLSGNVLRSSEFAYGAGGDDDVIAEFRAQSGATVTLHFMKDRLGSTAAVLDSSGNVLEEYRYTAFGSPYRKLPDGTWEGLGTETETLSGTVRPEPLTDRLYVGREWDSETGLHYYRARTYSPELGRFLQRDPAGQSDQVNPYAYVRNDPENFADPTGGVANFVAGAAVNVAMGAGMEYVSSVVEDREFSYSAKDALADAVSGAAGVGIAQKAARLGKLAKPLFESVADASANTLAAVIRSDCPKGRMTAGSVASLFGSQLVSQIAIRAQGGGSEEGFSTA